MITRSHDLRQASPAQYLNAILSDHLGTAGTALRDRARNRRDHMSGSGIAVLGGIGVANSQDVACML
jgi:hypothetical protein